PDHADENFTFEQLWASMSIYSLVHCVYSQNLVIRTDTLKNAISNILTLTDLSLAEFCSRLNLDFRIFDRVVHRNGRPLFSVVLDLCHRIEIPLDQFLFDRDSLTSPELWKNIDKPVFQPQSRLSDKKKKAIRS